VCSTVLLGGDDEWLLEREAFFVLRYLVWKVDRYQCLESTYAFCWFAVPNMQVHAANGRENDLVIIYMAAAMKFQDTQSSRHLSIVSTSRI